MTRSRTLARSFLLASLLLPAVARRSGAQGPLTVASPDGRNVVTIALRDGGLYYSVDRRGAHIVLPSRLGFTFRGMPAFRDSLRLTGSARTSAGGQAIRLRAAR